MDKSELKRFAQGARRQLLDQVGARLEQVLRTDSVEIREKQKVVDELQKQINQSSKGAVIDRVAYTWFNRFCALRFMDVNHYTPVGVVSPTQDFTQPEILQEAKQGVFDQSFKVDRERVQGLLNGNIPSSNPQQEAYRLLLVGACNAYHDRMPFLFEEIEDYTELLMPDDLLSENSVLQGVRDALTPEACQDVDVIGWLYQYYISERKDEVFANLKQNKKIQPEDIPAATQLFTPHWIVRYLVENSLGRLWMLNHPESKLVDQMEYYIKPEKEENDFLEIGSPEEIKVCDPACGSGHMLTYAFDLLFTIYEEQGYDPVEIPSLIVESNLFGIEIDERAGDLAAFALMMKARDKDKRFFERNVEPNVCVLGNVNFTDEERDRYMDAVGQDLFTEDFQEILGQFEQADNFGSLIRLKVKDVAFITQQIEEQGVFENLFLHQTNQKVMKVLVQVEYLSSRYHVVVANPPYMGSKGMNSALRDFANKQYPDGKSDLLSMFMEKGIELVLDKGFVGMITIPNWMFIRSFRELRIKLLSSTVIQSLLHNGRGVWGSDFGSCSFVIVKRRNEYERGTYKRLFRKQGEVNSNAVLMERFKDDDAFPRHFASMADLTMVTGAPIAYWLSDRVRKTFKTYPHLSSSAQPRQGLATGRNARFLRYWFEVSYEKFEINCPDQQAALASEKKWFPCTKGGAFRRWYGNRLHVVNWEDDGREIKGFYDRNGKLRSRPQNQSYYFREGISWTTLSISKLSMRYTPPGSIFETKGSMCFAESREKLLSVLAFTNSVLVNNFLLALSPTVDFHEGPVGNLPFKVDNKTEKQLVPIVENLVEHARADWDSYEISWDFISSPLLVNGNSNRLLENTLTSNVEKWKEIVGICKRQEELINSLLIDAYGLENEFAPRVSLREVTLTCNPHYRYPDTSRKISTDEERGILLLEDKMKEFISYAVGCMFGRYSLNVPGLVLANQGETAEDYLKQIPKPTFAPDEDNVIPLLDEGWFPDDITERFKDFLKITFCEDHYEENLAFLEEAIGRDIRSYFLKEFYKAHIKMYKKRPIYWMFSSPKGSFNALIYMHRYRPDTISVILNDYLRGFREKLYAQKAHL